MSDVDLSVVLYGAKEADLRTLATTLHAISGEFGRCWILLSGSDSDRRLLDAHLAGSVEPSRLRVTHRHDNLGFSQGHNLLLGRAFSSGVHAVLVLNADVAVDTGSLSRFCELAAPMAATNLVGPSLVADTDTSTESPIDSLGIYWSREGRHFDRGQGTTYRPQEGQVHRELGVTGACMLVSEGVHRVIVERSGYFFDETFLAYREDAELGIRARYLGVGAAVIDIIGFRHYRGLKEGERGNALLDLLGVRNRFLMRFALGSQMPGVAAYVLLRDAVVIGACCSIERRSLVGVREAYAIRRFERTAVVRRETRRR